MLLLAAAGCSSASPASSATAGDSHAAASPGAVTLTGTDEFRFAPARVGAHAGDVTVRLDSAGSYPHNIAFPSLHRTSATVGTNAGQARTTVLHLRDLRPGTYRFVCTFHSKAGMTGELVVA
jgi:plastocyanin